MGGTGIGSCRESCRDSSNRKWSQWSGLNRRPTVYETVALPLSYIGFKSQGERSSGPNIRPGLTHRKPRRGYSGRRKANGKSIPRRPRRWGAGQKSNPRLAAFRISRVALSRRDRTAKLYLSKYNIHAQEPMAPQVSSQGGYLFVLCLPPSGRRRLGQPRSRISHPPANTGRKPASLRMRATSVRLSP